MTSRFGHIKALAFDAYGTLFDTHSIVAACEANFPGKGDALSRLWRSKQLEYTWLLSLMGKYEDFWSVTARALRFSCGALGLKLTGTTEMALLAGYYRLEPFPDTRPALQALSNYRLAILSNGSPAMLHALVANAGLGSAFEKVFSVDAVKVYKPSPKAYQLTCDRLSLEPPQIGFVSGNSFDVTGASRFGLTTFWCDRNGLPLDELDAQPALRITSLEELAKALSG